MLKILVIGADGYMGWPLACELADMPNVGSITLLDNQITREKVELVGGNSIIPLNEFPNRAKTLQEAYPGKNIMGITGSVTDYDLVLNLIKLKFDVIFHLGHLRTAPYSMSNREACIETVYNNEIGFLNLIWSMKDWSRDSLMVKLGSFGAYAPTGLEIPEHDVKVYSENGSPSASTIPYPKLAHDFYHITKANDSLFARAACHNWGLKIVDVMQSTVFGVNSQSTEKHGEYTRFDYDEIYGTVLNRFLIQAMLGLPLSVYGDGRHSSGIMVLNDAIKSLSMLTSEKLQSGEYRVINNNPRAYKIIELAKKVQNVLSNKGHKVEISLGEYDPRHEKRENGKYSVTTAQSGFFDRLNSETSIESEINDSYGILKPHLSRVKSSVIYPTLDWSE